MIKTLFFPFSHISKDQLKSVTAFFPNLGFLPLVEDFKSDPMLARLTEQEILQPIFPLARDVQLVEKQVDSYLNWAQIHRGNEKNLKSLFKDQPYFMEDTGLSSIQSQIRKGTQKKEVSSAEKKAGQNPLLLLKFAQLLDVQNEDIDDELNALDQSKASLFSELTGEVSEKNSENSSEQSDSGSLNSPPSDPGRIMTEERVKSWFRYVGEKELFKEPGVSPLLITTSPAVMDYMVSESEGVINALDIDSIKVHENGCVNKGGWQQDFLLFLEEVIAGKSSSGVDRHEVDDNCLNSGRIKLCLFPEEGMKQFLNMPDQSIAVCLVQLKS